MSSYIKIKGNIVELITEHVERKVTLEDLFAQYYRQVETTTGILPDNCKLKIAKRGRSTYIIEQPPCVREVVWKGMNNDSSKRLWKLELPYCVFILKMTPEDYIGQASLFWRHEPIQKVTDKLYYPCLCNVDNDGVICTGSLKVKADTAVERCNQFVDRFWTSEFNTDLSQWFADYCHKFSNLKTLFAWQEATIQTPGFLLNIVRGYDNFAVLENIAKI
jgi:hypothetical protein